MGILNKISQTQSDNLKKFYQKFFSISEIKNDIAVQLFGGTILLGFLVTFAKWEGGTPLTLSAKETGEAVCWPFFQSCYDLIFMSARPDGYVQNAIFMVLLGIIFTGAYALLSRKYVLAHSCILFLFLWEAFILLNTYLYTSNYYYYHIAFCLIFLFLPNKRFFGSLAVVFFYFLSTAAKIHESWTLGTYFSALQTDLPILPAETSIIWTNIIIFIEMIGAWFLFSKNKILQRTIFIFFVIFHLYSGTFVGYHYPVIVTPPLLIFFGPLFQPFKKVPLTITSLPGWGLFLILFMLQMISHLIPGDEKITMEGNFYGLSMFAANHQCIVEVYDPSGNQAWNIKEPNSRIRCDAYRYWFQAKKRFCPYEGGPPFSLKIKHSINGGPWYEIVSEENLCSLTYRPFAHNSWIKTPDELQPIARPRKNFYH